MEIPNLQIESFLQERSRREMVLLFVLCFVLGFALVVMLLSKSVQNTITNQNAQNAQLNHRLFALQNAITTQSNLNAQDTQTIRKEIAIMEQKIMQQEERKRLALERFGVYFLRELADSNALYNVEIAQENGRINFGARGKYHAMLNFLESLQTQPKLSLFAMQLYPSSSARDLTLFATLQIQGE
ncbi:hypothetical protein [Helicobacter turcicus]|uniref:Uncharacterized protein n=1 Tax=Helicobacter turcicus TaxID=2867412 RepID=A0ABS7JP03_9HELI|nr:hypothetical protein [Helicobacter turcicus]MBX7491139.1 hypothetical protein [Helicobacter turcicus]MBX7546005.1 hypothetical protein [Helicobacter turcicus]